MYIFIKKSLVIVLLSFISTATFSQNYIQLISGGKIENALFKELKNDTVIYTKDSILHNIPIEVVDFLMYNGTYIDMKKKRDTTKTPPKTPRADTTSVVKETIEESPEKPNQLSFFIRPTTLMEPYTKVSGGVQFRLGKTLYFKQSVGYILGSAVNDLWDEIESGIESRSELKIVLDQTNKDYFLTHTYVGIEILIRKQEALSLDEIIGGSEIDTQIVRAGNIKVGQQFFYNTRLYLDVYTGLGIKYKTNAILPILPSIVAGIDVGFSF